MIFIVTQNRSIIIPTNSIIKKCISGVYCFVFQALWLTDTSQSIYLLLLLAIIDLLCFFTVQ